MDSRTDLSSEHKLAYLRDAIRDPAVKDLLFSGAERGRLYEEVVAVLQQRFEKKRTVHATYCQRLVNLTLPKATRADIHQFIDHARSNMAALKYTGQDNLEAFLTLMFLARIPKSLQIEWEVHSKATLKVPPVGELLDFLSFRADVLASSTASISTTQPAKAAESHSRPVDRRPSSSHNRQRAAVHSNTPRPQPTATPGFRYDYSLCPGIKHMCPKFNDMSVHHRGDHMRTRRLCFNYLSPGHNSSDCRSPSRCRTCGGKHHTMVHRETNYANPTSVNVTAPIGTPNLVNTEPAAMNVVSAATLNTSNVSQSSIPSCLMMTSKVKLQGLNGRSLIARALLDSGSSVSMISNQVAQTLQLPKQAKSISFSGAQDTPLQGTRHLTSVDLCTTTSNDPITSLITAIVPRVMCDLPLQGAAHVRNMPHISSLKLADPTFHLPGKIDILLGCDAIPYVMEDEHVSGPKDAPIAIKTVFGWAILGKYLPTSKEQSTNVLIQSNNLNPDDLLARFWQVEEPPSNQSLLTPEEESVQKHFQETHHYVSSPGHYQVSLPKVVDQPKLGLSRPQALHRFLSNQKNILRKGIYPEFQSVAKDYLDLGHAEPVPETDLVSNQPHYYMPMHGVSKASSTTTRLRVVFDASAKTTTGQSLNDILFNGPTLYPSLDSILIKFRLHKIAVTADVSKMYRAVHLEAGDRDLHRFLWRE